MKKQQEILEILAENRADVPYTIVLANVRSNDTKQVNRRIFASKLRPVPPSLCFFECDDDGLYSLSSFFHGLADPQYAIVPFGSIRKPRTEDFGISYNVFANDLPLQSYTICYKDPKVTIPKRDPKQAMFFTEYNNKTSKAWSAGHLIAHSYSPRPKHKRYATTNLRWNFIPEPYYWNCHQRNHLEQRSINQFYGVYPIYSLRYSHGRTASAYGCKSSLASEGLFNGILPYRPPPDGEFFYGVLDSNTLSSIYVPFLGNGYDVIKTSISASEIKAKTSKIDAYIKKSVVNATACPRHLIVDLQAARLTAMANSINAAVKQDYDDANKQTLLLTAFNNTALDHAALIRYERAASIEFSSLNAKMHCVLLFNMLGNRPKIAKYQSAIRQHAEILLDQCDAEQANIAFVAPRLVKTFTEIYTDEESTIDLLKRLRLHY